MTAQQSDGNHSTCKIRGVVHDRECKSIALLDPEQDARHDKYIEIKVVDGKFNHEFELDSPACFHLAIGRMVKMGSYSFMQLFLEKGEFELEVFTNEEFSKNTVRSNSPLNNELKEFQKSFAKEFDERSNSLWKTQMELRSSGKYFTKEMSALMKAFGTTTELQKKNDIQTKIQELRRTDQALTPAGRSLDEDAKEFNVDSDLWLFDYIRNKPTVVSHYLLYERLMGASYENDKQHLERLRELQQLLAEKFPQHAYTAKVKEQLEILVAGKVGADYYDFAAPDLDGKVTRLSDHIKGKYALIDLWATWCGSCIAGTKKLRPVYDEFKAKGFVYVGIAGEFNDTRKLEKFLSENKYPWPNLVELDRANSVWKKYGVPFSGGGKFLVNPNGKIIAVDPSPDDLRNILQKQLVNRKN